MPTLEQTLKNIQIALDQNDLLGAGTACSQVGKIFLERNLYQEAAGHYREASAHFAAMGSALRQARALNHLGICLVMGEDPHSALDILNEALGLLEKEQDWTLKAAIQGNLGLAYSATDEHINAIKSHKAVLEAAEAAGDDFLRLQAMINLADSNLQNKNFTSSLGFALVALDLAKKVKSQPSLVILYDLLGMISSRQGNLKDAAAYHQQAYQAALEIGDLLRQGIALANKGLALEGLTEMEDALEVMSQAEDLFKILNSNYLEKTRRDLERIRRAME